MNRNDCKITNKHEQNCCKSLQTFFVNLLLICKTTVEVSLNNLFWVSFICGKKPGYFPFLPPSLGDHIICNHLAHLVYLKDLQNSDTLN